MSEEVKKEENVVVEDKQVNDEIAILKKRLEDAQSFIGKQANEIGELRKMIETKRNEEKVVADKNASTENKSFFETLSDVEKQLVKGYFKKHLSELEGEDLQLFKEKLSDENVFNELAKEVYKKVKTPKHLEGIFESEKSKQVNSDGFKKKALEVFGLVEKEISPSLPKGGQPSGVPVKKVENKQEAPKKIYPNGGILSLTQKQT